jgi:MFS family permease
LLTPIIVFTLQNKDISPKEKDSWALYAMITLGFGQMFGGLIMGLLIDKFGSKKTTFINVALLSITAILSLVVIYQVSYNYITFICCFFWGLSDGALNIHSFQVLGSEFESTDLPFICLCLM